MNPANFKELAEQVAISVRHLRYLLEQIEWHIPKATVWAFGSRIKWSQRPESDLDLAVHCDKETAQKALPKLNYVFDESDLPFKVQILDFNRLPENMQDNIKKNYLVLYQPQEKNLPSGWKETTLGEVGQIVTGKTPPTAFLDYYGGNIPFVTPRDMDYRKTINTTERYLTQDGLNAVKGSYIPAKSIMVSCIGSDMGKVVVASKGCVTNQQINSIIAEETHYSPDFIYYNLSQRQAEFQNLSGGGSALPILNKGHFAQITITCPPLPEQKAIAAILSSFDDKIELLRRQNKTLEQIARTIFKESFVKDKIWDSNLSKYLKVQGGYAFKSEDFKEDGFAGIIKITNITMGVVDINNTQFVDEGIVTNIDEDKFRIKDGDFLIAMTGAEIGKIGIVEKTKKQIWLNQRVGKLVGKVPYGDIVGYLALKSREGQEHIVDAASGSAQANISSTGIEEMAFVPYSETDTNSFGEKVKPLFEKITFNLSQIQTLSRLRDALLPKLMKGEIRVKL